MFARFKLAQIRTSDIGARVPFPLYKEKKNVWGHQASPSAKPKKYNSNLNMKIFATITTVAVARKNAQKGIW